MNRVGLKLAFIVETRKNIRNFISTETLSEVSKKYELEIWHDETIETDTLGAPKRRPIPKLSRIYLRVNGLAHHCLLWRNRDRNMMMKTRALNQFGNKKQRETWKSVVNYEIDDWGEVRRLLVRMGARNGLFFIICAIRRIIMFLELNRNANWRALFHGTELILVPYGGHLSNYFDFLIFAAKSRGVISFALQENWDNLCTKSFLMEEPSVFGTWGEQSSAHLRSFHDSKISMIVELGSPRFRYSLNFTEDAPEKFHTFSNLCFSKESLISQDFSYVFVGGTGDGIDDDLLLKSTIAALGKVVHGSGLEIVFRPHPSTRTKRRLAEIWQISNRIIVDNPEGDEDPFRISRLVGGSEVVVNNFSTLTLEALLMGKPAIVPLFNGIPDAKWRYDRLIDEAPHYIGMKLFPGIYAPRNQEEFVRDLRMAISSHGNLESLRPMNLSWFCLQGSYSRNLLDAVDSVLTDSPRRDSVV